MHFTFNHLFKAKPSRPVINGVGELGVARPVNAARVGNFIVKRRREYYERGVM